MPDSRIYRIRKNRIDKSLFDGMNCDESGCITFERNNGVRNLFITGLDGGVENASWGRLTMDLKLDKNMVAVLRVAAYDEAGTADSPDNVLQSAEVNTTAKKRYFESPMGIKFINQSDVLLYDLHGRYLFIYLEILGEGTGYVKNITVNMDGDFFMDTFPEIYREKNGFFHRYMSVFSSMYGDMQREIDEVSKKLDVDTAPAELLEIFAEWMGLDLSLSTVSEEKLRILIKEGYELCKYKGTLKTLKRVAEILTDEEITIIERNQMSGLIPVGEKDYYDKLYGSNPYTVTVMVPGTGTPEKHDSLMHVLKQFTPVRCILQVVYAGTGSGLDGYSYLDNNASVAEIKEAGLDDEARTDGVFVLK